MNPTTEVVIEVPFHDVDLMGVSWHGHYYKYFELARTELFRKYDCDIRAVHKLGYRLPIIESSCRYISSLEYGMKARVSATLVETEYRLKVKYQINGLDDNKRFARGITVQVAVRENSAELCLVTPEEIVALFRGETCGA